MRGGEGWTSDEKHTCYPALSVSHVCMSVCVTLRVMTDVVPRCFPAADGLKVH